MMDWRLKKKKEEESLIIYKSVRDTFVGASATIWPWISKDDTYQWQYWLINEVDALYNNKPEIANITILLILNGM